MWPDCNDRRLKDRIPIGASDKSEPELRRRSKTILAMPTTPGPTSTPNLPPKIIPAKIAWLKFSGNVPTDKIIPTRNMNINYAWVKPSEIQNLSTEAGRSKDPES